VFDGQRFSSDRANAAGTGEPRESDQQVRDQSKPATSSGAEL
jgi:hypothetical protein